MLLTFLSHVATAATLSLSFGGGPRGLGMVREDQSSPEGPSSVARDAGGRLYILDEVNARVAVFAADGSLDASIALPSTTIEDMALLPSGDVVVLDRVVDRLVRVIAPSGAVVAQAEVEGAGVDDGGLVTGVFADRSGVWLEVFRGEQVRVLDAALNIDNARARRPGLPFGDGFVRMTKVGDAARVLFFDKSSVLVDDAVVGFGPLLRLAGLAVRGDHLFIAGHELQQASPTATPTRDVVVIVDTQRTPSGLRELKRHEAPASPEFVPLREVVVGGDGVVVHLMVNTLTQSGCEVRSW